MHTADAITLANSLRFTASDGTRVSAVVEHGRVVFTGGKRGDHSIDVGVSTQARVLSHFEGYCEAQEPAPSPACSIHGVVHA
jgi:hypothetical protein